MLENVSTGVFPAITAEDIAEEQKRLSAQRNDPQIQSSSQLAAEKRSLFFQHDRRSKTSRDAEERALDALIIPTELLRLDESFSQMVLIQKGFRVLHQGEYGQTGVFPSAFRQELSPQKDNGHCAGRCIGDVIGGDEGTSDESRIQSLPQHPIRCHY